jgi:tetratricopeptide (TPR) repeat protein
VAAFLGRTWWGAPSPAGPPVRVLIADFTNHTGDSYFEYTVRESLAIALQQSKAFAVLPRRQTLETLERMQLSAEDLNAQVFQEVALRANAGILISGEIDLTADGFLILLRAVDPRTDMPIALFTQSLSGKEELPIAIDRLSARLGQELAGTDLDDDQDIPPFAEVTTRSTDALERFTRALALRDEGRVPESVVLLKSAVEIDPEFAIAHGQLAIGQALVDRDAALQSAARAFAMRDRVGQREQHLIAATYHFLRSEFADAEQNYSAIALLYPDDAYVLRYLVQVRTELGQYQEAIDAATRLHQLEPENSFDHQITILVLVEAGRFEEALAAAQFARTRGFVGPTLERAEGLALLGQGMIPEARRLFADASTGLERNSASLYTSQSLLYEGRLEEAARTLESDLVLDLEVSGGRFGGARRYWLADTYRLMNRPDEALAQAMVLAAEEVSLTRIHQLRAAGVIFSQLGELDRARSVLERVERLGVESASPLVAAAAAQIQGEIARSERRDQDARYSLERANALWPFPAATWSLATLMESQGEYEEALALYAGIIGRKGAILRWDPSTLWVLAHLHAAGCLQAMGRFAEANRYRQEFDRLWESSNDFVRLPAPETQRSEAPNVPGLAFSAFYAR